jgi:hypothetical protein
VVELTGARSHVSPVLEPGVPIDEGRSRVPVGAVAPVVDVSLTYAVQVTGWLTTKLNGVQATGGMKVGCRLATVSVAVPELTA